eukprot:m.243566 g.243566  ORF g.243566 m.243566 type:complete len:105 (+) comp10951_c0_seq1:5236-5550(+)
MPIQLCETRTSDFVNASPNTHPTSSPPFFLESRPPMTLRMLLLEPDCLESPPPRPPQLPLTRLCHCFGYASRPRPFPLAHFGWIAVSQTLPSVHLQYSSLCSIC